MWSLAYGLLVLLVLPNAALGEQLVLKVSGDLQVMFQSSSQACDAEDIPDSTPRAFRDAEGLIHLFSTHPLNRAMLGRTFDQLKRDCRIVYRGAENDHPAEFNDRSWLVSFFATDGKTVYGLIHNEYQGHRRPNMCPSKSYVSCWYNSIALSKSEDGGKSFRRAGEGADALVIAPPSRYAADAGKRIGPASPSNIIYHNGYYYFLFVSEGDRVCIARSIDIASPKAWLIWDGNAFAIKTTNPYEATNVPAQQCPHLRGLLPGSSGTIVLHKKSGTFVLVQVGGPSAKPAGIYYLLSKDLIHWTPRALLWQVPARKPEDCNTPYVYGYPSLIDPDSPSRNFEVIGDRPWLLTVRRRFKNCRGTSDRDLVKLQVVISAQ